MKKVLSIFVSLIFLISAVGMTINSHFCGMNLRSVSLMHQDCCCQPQRALAGKKGTMPKGCCKNEIKVIKITDDYSPASQFHLKKNNIAPIVLNYSFLSIVPTNSVFQISGNHSPPPFQGKELVHLFRSLLL